MRGSPWVVGAIAMMVVACGDDAPAGGDLIASEYAQRAGVGSYTRSPGSELPIEVTVFDRAGARLGATTIDADAGGRLTLSLELGDGQRATHAIRLGADRDGYFALDEELVVDGERLLVTGSLRVVGDEVQPHDLRLLAEVGRDVPPAGGSFFDGERFMAELPLVRDGAAIGTPADAPAWMLRTGLGGMLESRAATVLAALRTDPIVVEALREDLPEQNFGHTTDCALAGYYILSAIVSGCPRCVAVLGASTFTLGWAALVGAWGCWGCLNGASSFLCFREPLRPGDCDALSCESDARVPRLSADEHSCECVCDPTACHALCLQISDQAIGVTYTGGSCQPDGSCGCNSATCGGVVAGPVCPIDDTALCAYQHPTTSCGAATRDAVTGTLTCATACGNNRVDTTCPSNPAYREACDASAGAASTCPPGQVCDACRCRPSIAPAYDAADPHAVCANGDYVAARLLFLAGVDIGFVRSEGDSWLMVAACAFSNGDYGTSESLAQTAGAKSSRGGLAHAMFIAEFAVERQGGDGGSYRDRGLDAAKQSGQCEGAANPDSCADGYRTGIRNGMLADEAKARMKRR